MRSIFLICLAALFAFPAVAQLSEVDQDRAREIGAQLRCVVCQNQSIEESEADLALDMKRIVRERVAAGDSDIEVVAYMRERYGDYVLLKPPVQTNTYLLWFGPALLVLFGLGWFAIRSRKKAEIGLTKNISDEDQALLDKIMEEDQ